MEEGEGGAGHATDLSGDSSNVNKFSNIGSRIILYHQNSYEWHS